MTKTTQYISTIGRRKTSSARVRLVPANQTKITINDRDLHEYFPLKSFQKDVLSPITDLGDRVSGFEISVVVRGGGLSSQAGAIRHGVARALTKHDADLRDTLKDGGYLKRDPRSKERRKFGLKKARKAPQWSKR